MLGGDHKYSGFMVPSSHLGSLMQDLVLVWVVLQAPTLSRHHSGSRWVDRAQEGASSAIGSTLSESQVCGPILNCPNVSVQEVIPWQVPRSNR